jgi:hypothetical protein
MRDNVYMLNKYSLLKREKSILETINVLPSPWALVILNKLLGLNLPVIRALLPLLGDDFRAHDLFGKRMLFPVFGGNFFRDES